MESYGIHWFRRDLRIAGNPALRENWKRNNGRVVGVFCFDKKFLQRPDFSVNRFQLFIETLENLSKELQAMGSELLFLDIGPHEAFPQLLSQLKSKPQLFSWNRDYEPFACRRDKAVQKLLSESSIESLTARITYLLSQRSCLKAMILLMAIKSTLLLPGNGSIFFNKKILRQG